METRKVKNFICAFLSLKIAHAEYKKKILISALTDIKTYLVPNVPLRLIQILTTINNIYIFLYKYLTISLIIFLWYNTEKFSVIPITKFMYFISLYYST